MRLGAEVLAEVTRVDRPTAGVRPARRMLARALWQDFGQVDFGLRRFRLRGGPARGVLEASAEAFLTGFNAAVCWPAGERLVGAIDRLDAPFRGFAYEGAGMASGLLDIVGWPGGGHVRRLLAGPALNYPHLVHVGAGWAFARLGIRPGLRRSATPDPLLRWLAWDGFGFHQGFFHADRVVGGRRLERGLSTDQRAIRDQGLGRSLWFHECADPEGIVLRVNEFPGDRRADLWAGVGLAAGYAGGVRQAELESLAAAADAYRAELAQGCVFACTARLTSGIVPAHTRLAAAVLAGVSPEIAAEWAAQSQRELGPHPHTAAHYQCWRAGIRRRFTDRAEGRPA